MSPLGQLPNRAPPNAEPMQWRRKASSPFPIFVANGPTRGSIMPIVPNEEPHAYDIAWARREMREGSDHFGSEPCSAEERKSAAFALPITSPKAHANSNTIIGAITSFIPSIHASIASVRSNIDCDSTRAIETNQPIVLAQINAAIESDSPSIDTCSSTHTVHSSQRGIEC